MSIHEMVDLHLLKFKIKVWFRIVQIFNFDENCKFTNFYFLFFNQAVENIQQRPVKPLKLFQIANTLQNSTL